MQKKNLSEAEIENLSTLLTSPVEENLRIGLQILDNYPQHTQDVYRELLLIAYLCEFPMIMEKGLKRLDKLLDKEQFNYWQAHFKVFSLFYSLYSYEDFEKHWHFFEKHEAVRQEFMPLILSNKTYVQEYVYLGERIGDYYPPQYALAETYLKIAFQHAPSDIDAINRLGKFYRYKYNDYDQALSFFQKAQKVNPQNQVTLQEIILLYLYCFQDLEAAAATSRKALQSYPRNYFFQLWLADALMGLNTPESFPEGEAIITQLSQQYPKRSSLWNVYGSRLWITAKRIQAAERIYLKGLEVNPNSYVIIGNLAELNALEHKNYAQAEAYYDKGFKINQNDTYHLGNCISLLVLHRQKYDKARTRYQLLRKLIGDTNKKDPEFSEEQWKDFQAAEKILKTKFDDLNP